MKNKNKINNQNLNFFYALIVQKLQWNVYKKITGVGLFFFGTVPVPVFLKLSKKFEIIGVGSSTFPGTGSLKKS